MPILTYHHIGHCPAEQSGHASLWVEQELLLRQLTWLRDHGWHSVPLSDVLQWLKGRKPLPSKWIAITFDDGWRDNYLSAYPVLREVGSCASMFTVTGEIRTGQPTNDWKQYVSREEILEMQSHGIEFGSHARSHVRLTKLSENELKEQVVGSREDLTAILGKEPEWFAYPFGNFSVRIAEMVRSAGYEAAVTTIRGNRLRADELFWLPRVMIMHDTTPNRLSYMLSGIYHVVHSLKNRKRWKSHK